MNNLPALALAAFLFFLLGIILGFTMGLDSVTTDCTAVGKFRQGSRVFVCNPAVNS